MAITKAFLCKKSLQLIAVMAESLCVGSFFVLVVLVCGILAARFRSMPAMLRLLFGASIAMFIISAAHLGLVIQELSLRRPPPENWRAQVILTMIQFVIGEIVLIWRLWVVWGRKYWTVIGPALLTLVAAGLSLNLLSSRNTFFNVVPVALIVANTSICTSLIAGRIWYVHYRVRNVTELSWNALRPTWWRGAVALVIESGVLYTATQVVSLVLHYKKSVALPILLDLQVPLIGIIPTLVIVLVHYELPDNVSNNQDNRPTVGTQKMEFENGAGTLDYHYGLKQSDSSRSHYQRHSGITAI
ncbi:hypothetical protein Hypma_003246 [Hypsizygus marmoreus]|uniref:Uncharacterized protein n=1 Tax=Hypsizygus marmoreus TaxID=39966 RepID=A0A369K4T0_HYPMA|nr:hypothetical protein Hypma_003246 [Hypsizygus marmoreus]